MAGAADSFKRRLAGAPPRWLPVLLQFFLTYEVKSPVWGDPPRFEDCPTPERPETKRKPGGHHDQSSAGAIGGYDAIHDAGAVANFWAWMRRKGIFAQAGTPVRGKGGEQSEFPEDGGLKDFEPGWPIEAKEVRAKGHAEAAEGRPESHYNAERQGNVSGDGAPANGSRLSCAA